MLELFPSFGHRRVAAGEVEIDLVMGGAGPPLLLLHGYPQTKAMWHKLAPRLARHYTVVASDLRGYGDSTKPADTDDHYAYSKRAMAQDQVEVMARLGFSRFMVVGHDRGARVAHRMALDHPDKVTRMAVLDVIPTYKLYSTVNQRVATGYYHWFFLIQPYDLPERLIGHDPDYYLRHRLNDAGTGLDHFDGRAVAEYARCFRDPATIHASCNDYRAGASIDLEHDEADLERKVACPVLVLWGDKALMHGCYDVLATWRERVRDAQGEAIPSGHFLCEEAPEETYRRLSPFLREDPGAA